VEPVFLFETILMYKHTPCYYKVFALGERFFGEPVPHHYYTKQSFPYFTIKGNDPNWHVEGVDDPEMVPQIVRVLKNHLPGKAAK
jgi:hypothetical protein